MITLAECTTTDARKLGRDAKVVVLFPLGAIEQHGPHLPLLVDWLGAEELARRIAPRLRRAGYRPAVAPSLPYGVSSLATEWSGTVSLSVPTLRRVITEVVEGLAHHGFRRFVLVNYQTDPGHLKAMAMAKQKLERRGILQVLYAGFAPGDQMNTAMVNAHTLRGLRSPRPHLEWHSGEGETSFVLAVEARLVRRAIARRLPPLWVDFRDRMRRGARRFEDIAPHSRGYFGAPALARPETGAAALALRARLIARELVQSLDAWRPRRDRR